MIEDKHKNDESSVDTLKKRLRENGLNFELMNVLGEGTFAVVYKARDLNTGELVSLKHIKLDTTQGGVSATSLREIALLRELQHECIIHLRDMIATSTGELLFVYDLMESDLRKFRNNFRDPEFDPDLLKIRSIMHQILRAIEFCHSRGVIHRDIKPHNILINSDLTVKVADFGLARGFTSVNRPMTKEVVTLWYRAPELLLGIDKYTPAVDIWSTGCVLFELVLQMPPFSGDSEWGTLMAIFAMCGTPKEEIWPGISDLKHFSTNFPNFNVTFEDKLKNSTLGVLLGPLATDLLIKMLVLNPYQRITVSEALKHPFFSSSNPLEGLNVEGIKKRQTILTNQMIAFKQQQIQQQESVIARQRLIQQQQQQQQQQIQLQMQQQLQQLHQFHHQPTSQELQMMGMRES